MNYPAWILNNVDVGLLVALIAIPHVYIAHLAVGGGLFLAVADTVARSAFAPTELPVGVLTAMIGGPFFLLLLRRRHQVAFSG